MSLSMGKTVRKVALGAYFILVAIVVASIVAYATSTISLAEFATVQEQSFSLNTAATSNLTILQGFLNDYPPPGIYKFEVAGMILEFSIDTSGNVEILRSVGFSESNVNDSGTKVVYNVTADKYYVLFYVNGTQYKYESNQTTDGNLVFTYTTSTQFELFASLTKLIGVITGLVNGFVALLLILRGVRESGVSI